MTEQRILINDLETNYKISGKGKLFLILHGWGSSSDPWFKFQEILARNGYQVFCPDLPGFGKSKTPPQAWNLDDYVNFVDNFIKKTYGEDIRLSSVEAPVEHFFLLGHSFGGRIAIKLAIKYPKKISGLILSGVPAIKDELNAKLFTARALAKFSSKFSFLPFYKFFRKIFYRYFLRNTDYLRLEGIMKETYKKIIAEDLFSYLSQIKSKTLILWGEKDDFVSVKLAPLMKEKIPNSKLIIFPNIHHSLHREIPENLAEVIIKFLKD